jgi:ABC-type transport system involved in multi-copper enzyme maturation permease subunit
MLWYKAWRETRWRFLIGLCLISVSSMVVVLTHPMVENLQLDGMPNLSEWMRERIREAALLMSTYPGYIWSQWFGKNLPNTWSVFAVLIGVGGVVTESARGTALFTLSLPITRRKLLSVRALIGALELAVLALVPSLLIPALSPLIEESYSFGDTLLYSLLTIVGGMVFFSFSFLLSSIFSDQLKPIVIGLVVVFIPGVLPLLHKDFARYNIYNVMSGQSYFNGGAIPWMGLLVCIALTIVMFVLSLRIIERRDF